MYRALPEVNRICCRAQRDRAYKQHLNALKNVRPSIDTRAPITPRTIGKNLKRYEIEKQRNLAIQNQNVRLVHRLDRILREEHYASQPPQRPFTLQGRWQKEKYKRITEENEKIIKAVQNSRPILNRNDWYNHQLDHEYQLHKNAEYKQTLPMSDIIKLKEEELQSARREKRQNEDDYYYDVHPPTQPSTSRNEPPYRAPQRQPPPVLPSDYDEDERHYDVHEPTSSSNPEENTGLSGIIRDQIEEDVHDQYGDNQNDSGSQHTQPEEDANMSIRDHIHDQVQEDVQQKEDGEQYQQEEGQPHLSLGDQIRNQVQEDVQQKEEGQQYQQEEGQPDLSIRDHVEQQVQEDIQQKQEEQPYQPEEGQPDLSLRDHIENQVKEDMEAKQEQQQQEENPPLLSIGNHITDQIQDGLQEKHEAQQEEQPVFQPQEPQQEGGFSIRAQIHETVAENYQEKVENTGDGNVYGGQQQEYQEFEPIKPPTPPEEGLTPMSIGDHVKDTLVESNAQNDNQVIPEENQEKPGGGPLSGLIGNALNN